MTSAWTRSNSSRTASRLALARPEFSVEGVPGTVYYMDYNGGRDEINAIGQTPTGIIVTAGYVEPNELFDTDFYVRAEQPLGNLVWDIEPIQGPAASADSASTLCLDRAGNIFVGGSFNYEGGISNSGWHAVGFTP